MARRHSLEVGGSAGVLMSILFCTPMYGGKCDEPFFHSAMRTVIELGKLGVEFDWLTEKNESLVHRARMHMAAEFLKRKEFTHIFWKDADLDFEPEHVAALWNLQTDIACGVYAMKKPDKQWFAAWKDGKLVTDLSQFDGPTEVDYAGTGFLLISRRAMEAIYEGLKQQAEQIEAFAGKIRAALGPMKTDEEKWLRGMCEHFAPHWETDGGELIPALFMTPIFNGGLESEDYHFCRLAREAGFKIIMDPAVRLGHWGPYRYGA